ncbi:MAG: hypothetical protein AAFW00_28620, partial [Bacteroidota bacterium]
LLQKDEEERKKCELTFRFRGLPKCPATEDSDTVKQLIEDLELNVTIESSQRVEMRNAVTNRTLHLISALADFKSRMALLKAAHKLKTVAGNKYKDVFIGPEYTKLQDRELYLLLQECRKHNAIEQDPVKQWVVYRDQLRQKEELRQRYNTNPT